MTSLYRLVPGLLCLTMAVAGGCGDYSASTEAAPTSTASVGGNDAAPAAATPVANVPATRIDQVAEKADRVKPLEIQASPIVGPTTQPSISTVSVEPAQLDLGTVPANQYATGSVTLTNTGEEPVTIQDCRTSCGCTTTNCPKGKQLQPGESTEVAIRMTAGSRPRRISKTVTFIVENQPLIKMPVSVNVVTFVVIEPATINPEVATDGRIVIRSTDDQPFRIVRMTPAVIEMFDTEPFVEHEFYIPWERWRELNQARRLTFTLDHPKASSVTLLIKTRNLSRDPNRVRMSDEPDRGDRAITARNPRLGGAADAPLEFLAPDAKLAVAIKRGDVGQINDALESGTVNEEDRNALLSMAARYGQVEVIDALIKAGADLEAKDKRGRTALMSAVQSRNADAVNALLAGGAKVDTRDEVQATALFRAAGPFGNVTVVGSLLNAGAQVNVSDKNGMTPLMWAVRFGDAPRVKALVDAGATIDARDNRGLSAMDYARNRRDKASSDEILSIIDPDQ